MSGETLLFVTVALVLLWLMLWLLREPGERRAAPLPPVEHPQIERLFALHCRHFPQIRQVLMRDDEEWLRQRAPGPILRRWRANRRRVAEQFLLGLGEDFRHLTQLARAVAALSPRLSEKQEAELFWLGVRFRVLYLLVRLRLRLGIRPLAGLTRLTELLGNLAAGIEEGMASLEKAAMAQLRTQQAGFSS
jgi:hypothetical protein